MVACGATNDRQYRFVNGRRDTKLLNKPFKVSFWTNQLLIMGGPQQSILSAGGPRVLVTIPVQISNS